MLACEDDPIESRFVRFTAFLKENMSSAAKRKGMLWSNGTTRKNNFDFRKQEEENITALFDRIGINKSKTFELKLICRKIHSLYI